ncbi:MAG: hypothetical protein QOK42_982 [Frankiaceae bacterium]|jgi:hypothetical protein|nr:hypothetical protein [Frankiaceae bacterium]MDX6226425.1 hypothetical protein [Frankiales bacterium]MDX6274112.1 hypothetical protein [Frankiales bacterium]
MVVQQVAGKKTGEDVDDLQRWLRGLEGCPRITSTAVAACANPAHDEPATWFYVEGDARGALARRRCLACGVAVSTFDSEQRWSHPPMWACDSCGQSIVELAAGLHSEDDDRVTWVALAVRCVGCGRLAGLTDFVVEGAHDEVLAAL